MENINTFLLISLIALMNYSTLSSPIYQDVCSNVSLEVNKGVAVSREVLGNKLYWSITKKEVEILFDAVGHIVQLKDLQPYVQVETNLQNDLIPINQILESLLEEACDWVVQIIPEYKFNCTNTKQINLMVTALGAIDVLYNDLRIKKCKNVSCSDWISKLKTNDTATDHYIETYSNC